MRVVPLNEQVLGAVRPVLLVLFGAVGCVLLLACVNVANLVLNRNMARERELAVRSALGAGRRRLVRQLLTEGSVLALSGGLLGVLLASWGLEWLLPAARRLLSLPMAATQAGIDATVLGFALVVSLATVLAPSALIPAVTLSRVPLESALRGGARAGQQTRGQRRLRRGLATVQIALASTLLLGAGLMTRSVRELLAVDPGFRSDHVLTMRVLLPESKYPEARNRVAFFDRLMEGLSRVPGVVSSGATSGLPFRGLPIGTTFSIEGRPSPGEANLPVADIRIIAGQDFETMEISRAGRVFGPRDGEAGRGAAIVNESLVRQLFPGENPIGQRVKVRLGPGGLQAAEIVGVVADARHQSLESQVRPMIYLPNHQMAFPWMGIVIRTNGSPASLTSLAVAQIRGLDPGPACLRDRADGGRGCRDVVRTSLRDGAAGRVRRSCAGAGLDRHLRRHARLRYGAADARGRVRRRWARRRAR